MNNPSIMVSVLVNLGLLLLVLGTILFVWKGLFGDKKSGQMTKKLGGILQESFNVLFTLVTYFFYMIQYILQSLVKLLRFLFFRKKKANDGDVFTGRYLTNGERKKLFTRWNRGLTVNGKHRITAKQSYRHLLLVGNSGAGKTTTFTMPHLLRETRASLVVLDPAGECFARTAGAKAKQGYTVKVLDPTNLDRTLTYNPLVRATTTTKIAQVVATLIRSQYGENTKDRFWNNGAMSIIRICLKALQQCGESMYTLHNLKLVLERLAADPISVGHWIADLVDETTWGEFQAFISRSESTMQGQLASAIECLNPFSDDALAKLTATDSIDLESLRKEKTVLYIIIPEHLVKYYSFLVSLLYSDLFGFLMEPRKRGQAFLPVHVIMDEFANTGRVDRMETYITCLRKRDVSISCLIQSLEQLNATYSPATAGTILDNCGTKIFTAGLGHKTTTELASMLGQTSIQVDRDGNPAHLSKSLLNPDELRCLRDREALIMLSNKRPWLAKMRPYYRQLKLRKMTKISFEQSFASVDRPLATVAIPTIQAPEPDVA